MSDYDEKYYCPVCGGVMEFYDDPIYNDSDDPHYFNGALICEDCSHEIPYDSYGFESEEEYEEWFENTYEIVYDSDDDD